MAAVILKSLIVLIRGGTCTMLLCECLCPPDVYMLKGNPKVMYLEVGHLDVD